MIRGDVVAAVEDMVAAVVLGVYIIRMLKEANEGGVCVHFVRGVGGDVEPVCAVGEERLFEGKGEDDGSHMFECGELLGVCGRELGREGG